MSLKKPREFFIDKDVDSTDWSCLYEIDGWSTEDIRDLQDSHIRVIEKSAYDKQVVLIEELVGMLEETDQYLCEHIIDDCGYYPEHESFDELVIAVRVNSEENEQHLDKIRKTLAKARVRGEK